MTALKHAFEKIGEGIADAFKGLGKDIAGAFKVIGGALTGNPNLMKSGAEEFESGLKEEVSGIAEVADGAVDATLAASPLGAALMAVIGPSAQKFIDGVFTGAANLVNGGISGVVSVASGIATGNLSEIGKGLEGVASVATLFVPGAGEAEMGVDAVEVAVNAGKSLIQNSAESQAESTVGV